MGWLKCSTKLYTMIFVQLFYYILITIALVKGQNQGTELEPEFLSHVENLTVVQGRDVIFTCVVSNLGKYRVAWIIPDERAILSVGTHMISKNPRISVTHDDYKTWKLHISEVQPEDSGTYMCLLNTDAKKIQARYLDVVVPPDILNQPDTNGGYGKTGISNEGGTIQLVCRASGVPEQTIQWRRADGKNIILRSDDRKQQDKAVKVIEGERLTLHQVYRTDMGEYLCIATNGVPTSVTTSFCVHVHFPPSIKAVNQLVGASVESQVTLECIVEVYPKPRNAWYRDEGNLRLYDGEKYRLSERMVNQYTWQMNLTIKNLQMSDFGAYICSSINSLGKDEARIRLQAHTQLSAQNEKKKTRNGQIRASETFTATFAYLLILLILSAI